MIKSSKRTTAKRSAEQRYANGIREEVILRDPTCRAANKGVGPCTEGWEWAHLGNKRRCFTRGMAPEDRHSTAWTMGACRGHHRLLDAHAFDVEYLEPEIGANGRLRFSGMGHVVEEP